MKITQHGSVFKVEITMDPPVNRFRPLVDYMFSSVAKIRGKEIVAVIMTGMGNDGAKGMKLLRDKGALTLGQDEKSCVVYGMPKEAKLAGGVMKEVPLSRLAVKICDAFIDKRL
jgi:two-component system chemotaxis response regulator CheB